MTNIKRNPIDESLKASVSHVLTEQLASRYDDRTFMSAAYHNRNTPDALVDQLLGADLAAVKDHLKYELTSAFRRLGPKDAHEWLRALVSELEQAAQLGELQLDAEQGDYDSQLREWALKAVDDLDIPYRDAYSNDELDDETPDHDR